ADARIWLRRCARGGRLAGVVDPDCLAVLQCRCRDWPCDVRRGRADGHRSWLARGATASMVASRLALAHRALCDWRSRELLAGRTSRRVLTTGHCAVKPVLGK